MTDHQMFDEHDMMIIEDRSHGQLTVLFVGSGLSSSQRNGLKQSSQTALNLLFNSGAKLNTGPETARTVALYVRLQIARDLHSGLYTLPDWHPIVWHPARQGARRPANSGHYPGPRSTRDNSS